MNNGRVVHLLIDHKPQLETHKIKKTRKCIECILQIGEFCSNEGK